MANNSANSVVLPSGAQRTTVEFRNETPFPVKVFRKTKSGEEVFGNLLDGYSRYTQEAVLGDTLYARLACNGWEVAQIAAQTYSQSCRIDAAVLRSKSTALANPKIKVSLDLPLRAYELFLVDDKGQESSLGKVDGGKTANFEASPGSVVRGAPLGGGKATYFWLIVTPQGQANVLGQTFSTGTGWGILPEAGEVAIFTDLAIGKDAAYEPDSSPSDPFYFVFHGDVPDLSVFFDHPSVEFGSKARTAKNSLAKGNTPAKPLTLDQAVTQIKPAAVKVPANPFNVKDVKSMVISGAKVKSGGPVLLAALVGPGTQAVFYEEPNFDGDSYSSDNGALPPQENAASIKIEVIESADAVGVTALTSLSEDVDPDEKEGGKSATKFRTTLCLPAGIEYVEISTWDDDVDLDIEGKAYKVGPNAPARISANEFNRITIKIDADEAGASELLVRTSAMAEGHALIICPDEEMHAKIAGLGENELHKSGLADPKFAQDDLAQVQKALQQISSTIINSHSDSAAGVSNKRSVDPSLMSDAHWVLSLDASTGKARYEAVTVDQATQINTSASKEIQDAVKNLGQSIFSKKTWNKVGKVVVHTAEDAGKAVANTTESVAKDVAKTTESAAKDVAKTAVNVAGDVADGVKYAAHEVSKSLVVTVHFLEDNVPGLRFVMRGASKVAALVIKSVVSMVGIAIEKLVKWLSFIFDWGDIEHTQKVFEKRLKDGMAKLKTDVVSIKKDIQTTLGLARKQTEDVKTIQPASQVSNKATSPAHNSALEKVEWFFSMLRKYILNVKSPGAGKALSGDMARIQKDFNQAMSKLDDDLKKAGKDISKLGKAISKGDFDGIAKEALALAIDLMTFVADSVGTIVVLVLDALATLLDIFSAIISVSFEIPGLSWLWKQMFGGRLVFCPLSVGLMIPAIFTTIGFKLAKGHAPFQNTESLALSSDSDVAVAYALAGVDFATGFSSAWDTLQAGAGPSGEPTATWKKVLKVIMAAGKFLHYVMTPVLCKDSANKAVVYGFSCFPVAAGLFALVPGVDEGPMNKGKCIADGIYGAVKIIVGSIEASNGHGIEGGILISEGAGCMMKLGGVSSQPEVYGLAAVGACMGMWTAAVLHVYRSTQL